MGYVVGLGQMNQVLDYLKKIIPSTLRNAFPEREDFRIRTASGTERLTQWKRLSLKKVRVFVQR